VENAQAAGAQFSRAEATKGGPGDVEESKELEKGRRSLEKELGSTLLLAEKMGDALEDQWKTGRWQIICESRKQK
jgi:hypothetical protein